MKLRTRLINVLVALDQFVVSLITMGSASPDETMSAAAFRLEAKLAGRIFRPLHCRVAYEAEIFGRQRARKL